MWILVLGLAIAAALFMSGAIQIPEHHPGAHGQARH
jgi:hypothetical protein